jgi:hypothetical protein
VAFLERVEEHPPLSHSTIVAMDKVYKFSTVINAEIRFRWQKICLLAEYESIFPHVVKFLTEQGRMKYTRTLYR